MIKRNDIRFIRLQFSDIVGHAKHVTIPVGHWDTAVSHGIWFDGSSVEGFARIAESDMYLVPDLATFAVVPWEMDLSTARVICDVYTPDGEPFAGDPRYVLKRQLQRTADMGLQYQVGPELEFFLFERHADGGYRIRSARAIPDRRPCSGIGGMAVLAASRTRIGDTVTNWNRRI